MLFASEVINAWGQFGLVGLVCGALITAVLWFMKHLLTNTFPMMLKTFTTELATERGSRLVQHQDNREDHRHMKLSLDELLKVVMARLEKMSDDFEGALKENRHAIKNLSSAMLTLTELMKAQWKEQRASEEGKPA